MPTRRGCSPELIELNKLCVLLRMCCVDPNPYIRYNLVPVARIYSGETDGIMVATGTMLRRSGHGPECLEKFRTERHNPDLATGSRTSKQSGWARPRRGGKALSGGSDVFDGHSCDDGRGRRFTNTVVPRFDGTCCWQQHLLIFQAIVKSNGWSPTTAALQFAHLDGEALDVALLMPVEEREQWTAFAKGLSDYFTSQVDWRRRRRFESASRRPGVDPATFATELGILAVREHARDLMVRNKFIAAQQSYALRRHLDGASADASIGEIVDSCRVWESHSEAGYGGRDLKFPHTISQVTEEPQSQEGSIASDTLQESTGLLLPTPALSPLKVTRSSSDRELLIQRIMEAICPGRSVIQERSQGPDIELGLRNLLPVKSIPEMDAPTLVSGPEGRVDPSSAVPIGPVLEVDPPGEGVGSSVFLMWTPGTWGEPMLTDGHFFSLLAGWLVGRPV